MTAFHPTCAAASNLRYCDLQAEAFLLLLGSANIQSARPFLK
jgi:hypothetical protein